MRNNRLDVLRCVAVLLVLMNHGRVSEFFNRTGWAGVDFFFVLSGFLISGLLFGEHEKHGTINFKRFFIRRGLKIYPAFYVFLILTAMVLASRPAGAAPRPLAFSSLTPACY